MLDSPLPVPAKSKAESTLMSKALHDKYLAAKVAPVAEPKKFETLTPAESDAYYSYNWRSRKNLKRGRG